MQDDGVIKILFLSRHLERDDGDRSMTSWLNRLESRGFACQVLCVSQDTDAGDRRAIEVPAAANRFNRGRALRRLWSSGLLHRPDIMHLVDDAMIELALALAQDSQLPYVQTVSHFSTLSRGLRLSRRWCRRLIATGEDLGTAIASELGVPSDRITVIPPGIVPRPRTTTTHGAWRVPVIGAGGRFEETSGLITFLDAARLVVDSGYDTEFVLATHAGGLAELRRRAQALRIADRVTVGEYAILTAPLFDVLDVYCHPAVAASSGRTLLRALAHGVACVTTNVHGLRSLVEAGTSGLVVPPDDARALGNAIIYLLEHRGEAHRLGQNGLAAVQARFDPDAEADRLASVYRRESRF